MKTVEVREPAFLSHVTSCLWLPKALTMMLPRDPSFQNHPWGCFQLFPILSVTPLSNHPVTSVPPHFRNDLLRETGEAAPHPCPGRTVHASKGML